MSELEPIQKVDANYHLYAETRDKLAKLAKHYGYSSPSQLLEVMVHDLWNKNSK
jgi:predicted kinase